jgi:acetolactate synthase-1/3 small subunit
MRDLGPIQRHTLAVTVDNESGVLAKIVGMFSARGYNIESLTVADVTEAHDISRITIVTSGTQAVIDQIEAQLSRLVTVHNVSDLTALGPHVEREMALLKVAGTGEKRLEAMRLADIYRARVVDATTASFIFEITGSTDKVDTFTALMREVGLVEVARGGVVAISRGKDAG